MARPSADACELSVAGFRDLVNIIEQRRPLPDTYRFNVFVDTREVELVLKGTVTREMLTRQRTDCVDYRSGMTRCR
jgi:hypothetical protein